MAWRPKHAGDARAAALELHRQDAIARFGARPDPRDATPIVADDLPYRRVHCPGCGRPDDERHMFDVRALSDEQRISFGLHPDAAFVCTHVCLNDAFNAGVSKAQLYAALGAPNHLLARFTEFDDANPARAHDALRIDALPRRRAIAGEIPLDS